MQCFAYTNINWLIFFIQICFFSVYSNYAKSQRTNVLSALGDIEENLRLYKRISLADVDHMVEALNDRRTFTALQICRIIHFHGMISIELFKLF